jgi:hypothetical protein
MDIEEEKEKETITVEPIEDPVRKPEPVEAPEPVRTAEPVEVSGVLGQLRQREQRLP